MGSLIVVGALLRTVVAAPADISPDESFSWRLARYPVGEILRRTGEDVHPPLYYLLLKGWVAVAGDSPEALRGFSTGFGLLCVPLAYAVTREVWAGGGKGRWDNGPPETGGCWFAAALMAVHMTQVLPGATARMYSLGVFFCGVSTWVLLRALRAGGDSLGWWVGYGLSVAAFCYTHYYAFFSVLGQMGWLAARLVCCNWPPKLSEEGPTVLRGTCLASTVAASLYLPWVPDVIMQVRGVSAEYWIEPVTLSGVLDGFLAWSTGLRDPNLLAACLWVLLCAAAVRVALIRCPDQAAFFLVQAAVPWVIGIGVSVLGSRPVLVARYLVFAHFFVIGFWGTLWNAMTGTGERALLALLVLTVLLGIGEHAAPLHQVSPARSAAAGHVAQRYQAGDAVWVGSPAEVNRMMYYLSHAGCPAARVQCRGYDPLNRDGRYSHVAALESADIVWSDEPPNHACRVWVGQDGRDTPIGPPSMRLIHGQTFVANGRYYTIALYGHADRP